MNDLKSGGKLITIIDPSTDSKEVVKTIQGMLSDEQKDQVQLLAINPFESELIKGDQGSSEFTEGHGFVPYDGAKYEIIYDCDGSEIVVPIRFEFGPPCLTVDLRTGNELSEELEGAEIKAWREI